MFTSQKRKGRWSQSLFGSKATGKVVILEDPAEGDGNASPRAIFRRSGSKMLSLLRLTNSNGAQAGKSTSSSPSDRGIALAIARDDAAPTVMTDVHVNARNGLMPLQTPSASMMHNHIETDHHMPEISPPSHLAAGLTFATPKEPSGRYETLLVPAEVPYPKRGPAGLRQSRSMPGIAHQLSHKLSSTFGNPTVVHRPSQRSRPSFELARESPTKSNTSKTESPQADTDPSSFFNSGTVSLEDRSTGKTSVESNAASINKDRPETSFIRSNRNAGTKENPEAKPLTPIPEVPTIVKPTMVTVETTANAKIFFETHFNSLLSGQTSPRSLRRNELENLLEFTPLTADERYRQRCEWAKQESEYLRQSRVLKSKSNRMVGNSGVSVAGYEVVSILGKGSFGVVRLVRQKTGGRDDSLLEGMSRTIPPREELSSPKMRTIDAIRSTLDAQKLFSPRSKAKREVFAMKVIRKSDMLRNCQEGHLRAERDFLVASEKSRWVVPLIASFQDNTNLYLVMEYMIGGDFLGLLIRRERLSEKSTRWYIAEMILCVEEAHRLRWIHRDVKPDNFLISASGHLKISDFGLAFDGHWAHDQGYFNNHRYSLMEKLGIKVEGDSIDRDQSIKNGAGKKIASILTGGKQRSGKDRHEVPSAGEMSDNEGILQWRNRHGKRKLAVSVLGTSQYMAPEVVRGDLYDGRCDWWSVAIIMYECLYGRTPFMDEDRQKVKQRVLNHESELCFPSTAELPRKHRVSHEAKELINSILQKKELRLCSKKYMLNDYELSKRSHLHLVASNPEKQPQDYQGYFVFPDDATDIKSHAFFDGICWDHLHLSKPPWVPSVKSRDDTTYFDEDIPISDVDDAPSTSSIQEEDLLKQEAYEDEIAAVYAREVRDQGENKGNYDGIQSVNDIIMAENAKLDAALDAPNGELGGGKKGFRPREKRRPRDRILRDKQVAKQVLELRKKGAFLGYTYQRPKR
ncbi:MAG: hypothetical protein Q9187_007327, partial [Circinaria calcarea]